MEIKVYLHRTKKKNFEVVDSFPVFIDLDKLPEDINYINMGFENDVKKLVTTRDCIKKYGTGYISFIRPQYEGPDEENGNDKIYFDNTSATFKLVSEKQMEEKDGEK